MGLSDRWSPSQWRYIERLMEKGKPYQEDNTKMDIWKRIDEANEDKHRVIAEVKALREALKESLELTGSMFDLLIEGVDNPKLPELRARFEEAKQQFAKVTRLR